jgi:hypothetical protein
MMTQRCEAFERLIQQDDESELELHVQTCTECAEKLAVWREISEVSKSLEEKWESPELWPKISLELQKERSAAVPAAISTRQRSFWQLAASFLLLISLGTLAWRVTVRSREQQQYENAIIRNAAIDEVEKAERAHVESIDRLEQIAGPQLEASTSPLMSSYREKLLLIDDAIRECETNVQHNRYNAHLRRELLSLYGEKQRTLRQIIREDSHVQ